MFPNTPATLNSYGGAKQDYIPVVNPKFGWSAQNVNEAFKDVAEITNTAIQARVRVRNDGYGPALIDYQSVWSNSSANPPTITAVSTGVFNIVFPTSFVNELGNTITINVSSGWGNLRETFGFICVNKLTPNSVQIKIANSSGAANALTGTNIDIWVV